MKRMFLSVIVAMLMVSMPLCVKAEEKETTTYSYDYSEYNGGDPNDYQYSFDKENWTSERSWEVEVGKMYKLYVKCPDGSVGLVCTFVPEAENENNEKITEQTTASEKEPEIKESKTSSQENVSETVAERETNDEVSDYDRTDGFRLMFTTLFILCVIVALLLLFLTIRRKTK